MSIGKKYGMKMKVKENKKAPAFKLTGTKNMKFDLKNFKGKLVIYFYPKDDTPGCTIETNDFNKLLPKFKNLNCEIIGISKDNLKSHLKFKDKYKIKFQLLADEEKKVLKKYKVWAKKKFMGKEFLGVVRTTFLIDKKGRIIKIWNNVKVKDHAKEVLETLKNIIKK